MLKNWIIIPIFEFQSTGSWPENFMKIDKQKTAISRREFFSFLVPVLSVPAIFWWLLTGRRGQDGAQSNKIVEISNDIPAGVSFQKDIILIREQDSLRAYESKCTHLGCRISKVEGKELVCGCHGSRFDMSGKAVRGPAIKPLNELEVNHDVLSGNLIITKR